MRSDYSNPSPVVTKYTKEKNLIININNLYLKLGLFLLMYIYHSELCCDSSTISYMILLINKL